MAVLLIAEHDNAALGDAVAKAVTAGRAMADDVHVLVAGAGCADVASQAAAIEGVAKVMLADDAAYKDRLAEPTADLIMSMADGYSHVIAAATASGKNLLARVAGLLDVQIVSDITEVKSADTFVRPIYAGNAMATVKSNDAKKVVTVRSTTFAAAGAGGSAPIEPVSATAGSDLSEHLRDEVSGGDRPQLTSAKIVVSGGRGVGSQENFAIIDRVADKLGAAVGASRAAVDSGYAPNDYQVGQTGKVVAPELYIAVGISGAIQHLAGMKDSKVIVAINKDDEAPIFQVADYGLVADLFDVMPELEAEIEKVKA